MTVQKINAGALGRSNKSVWNSYNKLTDDLITAKFTLCEDIKTRYIVYHKIIRMQLLKDLLSKILSRYSTETLTSLSKKLGCKETKLSSILNHPDYEIDRETEIKIFNYLYVG